MKTFDKNDINELCPNVPDSHFLNTRIELLSRIRHNLVQKIAEIDTKIVELKQAGPGASLLP